MAEKYYTVRQYLTNEWQERYLISNKLNKPRLSVEERKLLENLKQLLPSIGKILQVSNKAKKICIEKNLPFHRMQKGAFKTSSVFVFPASAIREALE